MNHDDYWPLLIIVFWICSTIYTAIFAYEMLSLIVDARVALQFYISKG